MQNYLLKRTMNKAGACSPFGYEIRKLAFGQLYIYILII